MTQFTIVMAAERIIVHELYPRAKIIRAHGKLGPCHTDSKCYSRH